MPWRKGLSPEQVSAAQHVGRHARLLAGPGTGKTLTLTRRALALVLDRGVDPHRILALTFTRVAAFQLRTQLEKTLKPLGIATPRVSTLHSFALRQLLRNAARIEALPKPLRIADDWEERWIIQEDIKDRLQRSRIDEIRRLFQRLSADWERLTRDDPGWEEEFPDAAFLGAWREHRTMLSYTLRAELVYQLRRALNQYPGFELEDDFQHVMADEYQDFNACDLAVIRELAQRGCEIYVAGDDDQSIYGFRYADPEGIRRFTQDYQPSRGLSLEVCYRCDSSILRVSEFVADLDVDRLPRITRARDDAVQGEVHLLHFRNQYREANGVARLCEHFIQSQGLPPDEILILLRSDHHRALSSVLQDALVQQNVPAAEYVETSPVDTTEGRRVLAVLRLLADLEDSLAWRTVLQLRKGIGQGCMRAAREFARRNSTRFSTALEAIRVNPQCVARVGNRIASALSEYVSLLKGLAKDDSPLPEQIHRVAERMISDGEKRLVVEGFLISVAEEAGAQSLAELVSALGASLDAAEQELAAGCVNILTMHKAKGLSADAVFIVGAEDEFIPGRNEGQREGDERRLLFVSMTRARHNLFITYCGARFGRQARLGRASGRSARSLTRFLRDAPIRAKDGTGYVASLAR